MESYDYMYQPSFPPMGPPEGYPDRGDGFGEYYGMGPLNDRVHKRRSRSTERKAKQRESKRSRSRSRSKSRTSDRTQSRSRSQSRTHTHSHSRSRSSSHQRHFNPREPGFLDAFRVLYLKPSKQRTNTAKYLATKKRQDRIQEILKSDGLGSKRWLFYPRSRQSEGVADEAGTRSCDQRVKIDGDFFRKYKRSRKVDTDAPIAKLKRWELIFYKKLGFIQAV